MTLCPTCGQMPSLCLDCVAERMYWAHEAAVAKAAHHDDVARRSYVMLRPAEKEGWRAVAKLHREMAQ